VISAWCFGWQFIFDPVNGIYNLVVVDVRTWTEQREKPDRQPEFCLIRRVILKFRYLETFSYRIFTVSRQNAKGAKRPLRKRRPSTAQKRMGRFWHVTLPELRFFIVRPLVLLRISGEFEPL